MRTYHKKLPNDTRHASKRRAFSYASTEGIKIVASHVAIDEAKVITLLKDTG